MSVDVEASEEVLSDSHSRVASDKGSRCRR